MITADEVRKLMPKLSVEEELKDIERVILDKVKSNSKCLVKPSTYLVNSTYQTLDSDFINEIIFELKSYGYRAEYVKPEIGTGYLVVSW